MFNLIPEAVDVKYLADRVLKSGSHTVKTVHGTFLLYRLRIEAHNTFFSHFTVCGTICRGNQPARILLRLTRFLRFFLYHLQRFLNVLCTKLSLIQSELGGEGDYQSFFVILHVRAVFLEPALMVIEMFLFRFKVNIRYVIYPILLISKSPPACSFRGPIPSSALEGPYGLCHYIVPSLRSIVLSVVDACQPCICADHELAEIKFICKYLLERLQGLPLACVAGLMQNARGSPSASMNIPICTIGLGRCSFDLPYLRRLSSRSISK